ncbi:unnamed protein product [Amoebophrya sp. A120]|nr:unnamed protein product [Amoebophrya sp. A120]|eukprot:GSA120T00020353001.1
MGSSKVTKHPLEAAASLQDLKKKSKLLSIRFQAPELDLDVGVAVRLGTSTGSSLGSSCSSSSENFTAVPCMAADLITNATNTLHEYFPSHSSAHGEDRVTVYAKRPHRSELRVRARGSFQDGGSSSSTFPATRLYDEAGDEEEEDGAGAETYARSVRHLISKLEESRKVAALKDAYVEVVAEKYTEAVKKLTNFRQEALKEIANLRNQLAMARKDGTTYQHRSVTFLDDAEIENKYGVPGWQTIVDQAIARWEGEQLKEFAFSKLLKPQTENEKKLQLVTSTTTGTGPAPPPARISNDKDFHVHRNPNMILDSATEVQKVQEMQQGEYFEYHKIVSKPEPEPPLPLFLPSPKRNRANAICDLESLEKQRRHSVHAADLPKPSAFGDMRVEETEGDVEKKKTETTRTSGLNLVSSTTTTQPSTRATSGARTPVRHTTFLMARKIIQFSIAFSPSRAATLASICIWICNTLVLSDPCLQLVIYFTASSSCKLKFETSGIKNRSRDRMLKITVILFTGGSPPRSPASSVASVPLFERMSTTGSFEDGLSSSSDARFSNQPGSCTSTVSTWSFSTNETRASPVEQHLITFDTGKALGNAAINRGRTKQKLQNLQVAASRTWKTREPRFADASINVALILEILNTDSNGLAGRRIDLQLYSFATQHDCLRSLARDPRRTSFVNISRNSNRYESRSVSSIITLEQAQAAPIPNDHGSFSPNYRPTGTGISEERVPIRERAAVAGKEEKTEAGGDRLLPSGIGPPEANRKEKIPPPAKPEQITRR